MALQTLGNNQIFFVLVFILYYEQWFRACPFTLANIPANHMFKTVQFLRNGERKSLLRPVVECFSSQCRSGPKKSSRRNRIKRAKLCGEIPPLLRGFSCPHSGSSRGAVLVRGESLQCICCTERHVNLYGTQNSKWKPNGKRRHPELPWEAWSRSEGLWPWHIHGHLSGHFPQWFAAGQWGGCGGCGGQPGPSCSLRPLPRLAVNCRSFKETQASVFSKQNSYPVLSEKCRVVGRRGWL